MSVCGVLVLAAAQGLRAQDTVPLPSQARLAELDTNPYRGDTAMVAAGAKLYRVCAVCHGERGAGGARGPELSKTRLSDRDFFRVVMQGRTGTLMPAWRDKLSPGEVWQIHAFLGAAPNQATAPPQELPAPAVHPKQCGPISIARPSSAARSASKMVRGAEPATGRSSIWLKSQS